LFPIYISKQELPLFMTEDITYVQVYRVLIEETKILLTKIYAPRILRSLQPKKKMCFSVCWRIPTCILPDSFHLLPATTFVTCTCYAVTVKCGKELHNITKRCSDIDLEVAKSQSRCTRGVQTYTSRLLHFKLITH